MAWVRLWRFPAFAVRFQQCIEQRLVDVECGGLERSEGRTEVHQPAPRGTVEQAERAHDDETSGPRCSNTGPVVHEDQSGTQPFGQGDRIILTFIEGGQSGM